MTSTPSGSFGVRICSVASRSMRSEASTWRPSTLPATVALARPGPIERATSMTVTGWSNSRLLPSGRVIVIMGGPGDGIREGEERIRRRTRRAPARTPPPDPAAAARPQKKAPRGRPVREASCRFSAGRWECPCRTLGRRFRGPPRRCPGAADSSGKRPRAPRRPAPWHHRAMTIRGRPTSLDIAYLAGVSQPTVSRALRGSPMVNEETRKRILEIAKQLNYKVDKNASNLRAQQSGTLALLFFMVPAPDDPTIIPFSHPLLGSITRACARHGYDLLVSFQQLSDDWHADFEDSHKADGLILLGYGDYLESRARLEQLVAQGTSFVRWGAALPRPPGVPVGCDNFQGGFDMGRHLLTRGYR